ncbi:MAG: leucine-rich repeat protein [Bacteroidales bacterium]|nr:leucine-rich repeat protein [Bacteroidales bacterium]
MGSSYISHDAFAGCKDLTSVVIGDGVTSIGNNAFSGCMGLTSFEIPSSVTSIGTRAFEGCTGLTSIEIPSGVTSIGDQAFSGCAFDTLVCNNNAIGTYFQGNKDFTKTLIIGNEVTRIPTSAFSGCSGLKSVIISSSVTSIGNYAFQYCTNLTYVEIGNSVTSIGKKAFENCQGTLYLNGNIDNFLSSGEGGFSGAKFSEIVVGDNVSRICKFAFADMTDLRKITLGRSVNRILGNAFTGCIHLTEMYCQPTTPPACASTSFDEDTYLDCTVLVPEESLSQYQTDNVWRNFFDMDVNSDYRPTHQLIYQIDGTIIQSVTVEEGATITAINAPVREGYTFLGWSGLPDDMIMPDHDLTVIGTYAENSSVEAETLAINDGDALAFPSACTCETLAYSRTFSSTQWHSLYVPFAIPVDSLKKQGLLVAELNDTHQWDLNGDGVADSTRVEFFTLTSGSTLANYPYLIRAKDTPKTFTLRMEDVEVAATEENSYECSSFKQRFTVVGTYAGVSGQEMWDNNYYGMSGGGLKRVSNATVSLKPQRWYMKVENKNGDPVTYYAASLRIAIDGIDEMFEATDINAICGTGSETAIYGIDGVRYRQKPSVPGLYVQDGKKFIIH